MALKGRLRSKRSKRFNNVSDDFSSKAEEMNSFSSDSQSETGIKEKKVRKGFTTKGLMKESECFAADNDHVYSCVRSSENDYNVKKRQIYENCDEKLGKKRCFSKNALMAKLNRERKKLYVSSLETENESLRKEKSDLNRIMEEQNMKMKAMSREILYLKGLLANSKELVLILSNLREMTGLPVTSSMIHATSNEIQTDSSITSPPAEQDDRNLEQYQPRVKCVKTGNSFPILDKDINLGSCSDTSLNTSVDLENFDAFDFEDFSYDISQPTLKDEDNDNNSYFSFCNKSLNSDLEECFQLKDLSKNSDPQVGICLHVNQKKISVEICSICNGKAASSLEDFAGGREGGT